MRRLRPRGHGQRNDCFQRTVASFVRCATCQHQVQRLRVVNEQGKGVTSKQVNIHQCASLAAQKRLTFCSFKSKSLSLRVRSGYGVSAHLQR